jgi:hypothetical protein
MRILTVRQPWAWAIIHAGKDVENRTRNIAGDYRGPVAIHVAGKYAEMDTRPSALAEAQDAWCVRQGSDCPRHPWQANVGMIIGVVDLIDVHSASVIGGCGRLRHDCPEHGTCREHCSPWADGPSADGWFQHLVLANPRPLVEQIPYRGALSLRTLDDDTTARILEGIA